MGKSKKFDDSLKEELMDVTIPDIDESATRLPYEEQLLNVSVIAKPMAPKKLAKKLYKVIKKAYAEKTICHGLKTVQARIRKGDKGLVVIAGDVSPIDIICHMPAVCEEKDLAYVFTPSRSDLGLAMGVKRTCLIVLVKENPNYKDLYDECAEKIHNITISALT